MKQTKRCPKCGDTNLFHSDCVMDRGEGNEALRFAIGRSGPIDAREMGVFEVYVCRGCGYSEFYVSDPGELSAP